MKNKLLALHFLFLLALMGVFISSFVIPNVWFVSTFEIVAVVTVFIIFRSWMVFLERMVQKSNAALNNSSVRKSVWAFSNIKELEDNQEQVARKFELSAQSITDLAQPEKTGSMNALLQNDSIGKALQNIRSEMQRLKDEDEKQAWVTTGLAQFSSILRNKSEVKEYSQHIISNLVKYIGANQGGLFIEYQDDDHQRYLELTACYAYDKKKHVENRIVEGQGILGQCMLEKDFVFLTDIPKDYVRITSGLGFATPRNVVVAPLIFNDKFCGAIELALFEIIKPHQVEFLKKVCENIASEIASLKTVAHTQELLKESNTLAQELRLREDEMKQNIEELAATQEEMGRKQAELSGIINAIDSTLATAEFDLHGNLIKSNSILVDFFSFQKNEFQNFNYTLLVGGESDVSWTGILRGDVKSGDFKTQNGQGHDLWLSITFTTIHDVGGTVSKVLCLIQNITQKKIKEHEFERLSLVANNTDNSVIITDHHGITEYVNAGFVKITGYDPQDIIGKKPGKLLQGPLTDKKTIEKLKQQIADGAAIYEEILNYNKGGETYWVSLAINPVRDAAGKIIRFISIQADITETKIRALDFHQKMEALSRSNAIIELDKKGIIIDINENYLELLNYDRHEIIGKPYELLTHKANVFDKLLNTIDESGMQSGVFTRFDKQGNKHCMKLMDYPLLHIHGAIQKIIEFGVDVTNEKRLEKEAERRQAELKSYLAGINSTIASAEFNLNGVFQDANDIFLKVMCYSKSELLDKKFEFFMGEEPNAVMLCENVRLGKFFSGEFKMKDKSGREHWLTGTFNPIIIENNIPEKIMMFAQFTTQEKEKLSDLNGMVHALKSALPVLEFNENFACKTANEKAMKIFSLSRMEIRNKTIFDFIAPYYHVTWKKKQDEILGVDFSSIVLPILSDAQTCAYEVSISVTRNLEGKVMKIIVILVKEVQDQVSVLATA